jgi:hypothetical protein
MTTASPERLLTELRWNWDWSPAATAVIVAVAAAWVIGVYVKEQPFVSRRRRAGLALLRLAAVGLALAMLAQPTIERRRVAPPRLVLLVDDSASMDTRDVAAADLADAKGATGQVTRREAWENLLTSGEESLLDELRSRFAVETLRFASDTSFVDLSFPAASRPEADGAEPVGRDATHLGDAIDFALRGLAGPRPAAAVVMTDGVNTAGRPLPEAAARARTLGVPIYAVALGSDRPGPDVAIEDVVVEEVVFPGDRLQVEAAVRSVGYEGRQTEVVLRRAGDDTVLAKTQVKLGADGEARPVRLALRPSEPGPLALSIEVDAQSDEDDVANNRAELTIDVRDQPIRVLLVDSRPTYEYRALKSLLERDPAIDLRTWLQDADADFASVDEAALRSFPATEAEWLEYDVVLLGDADPRLLPRQTWDLLEKFVTVHGGGFAAIAGQQYMPRAYAEIPAMRTLLPIEVAVDYASPSNVGGVDGWKVAPTPLGMQEASLQLGETADESAAIWSELPGVLWTLPAAPPKPGAQVLAAAVAEEAGAAADSPPIILRQYVGAGEVLMHATDETWRWRWRNDDRYFARYWGQAVRRLARGRALRGVGSLATNRTQYNIGEPVTIRLRPGAAATLADEAATVELSGESTPTRAVRLSRRDAYGRVFETTLRNLPADRYTARSLAGTGGAAPLSAEFVIAAPPAEMAQLVVNSAGLREAAESTGGQFYTAKTAARLRDDLPRSEPATIERLPEEPLWNSPWFLIVLCGALGSEWLFRRRWGML